MLLGAELLDELVSGAWIAAWPQVRADLALSYVEVGLLLSAPAIVASLVEPAFGFLGDAGRRRALVRGGGVAFVASLVLVALSPGFWPLLAALAVLYPATGAFVGLSQATLMDAAPEARERNMARWVLAGSVGALAGPLLVGAMARGGLGWRSVAVVLAATSALLVLVLWRLPPVAHLADDANGDEGDGAPTTLAALADGAREAWRALRRRAVVRWLALLELADLMVDGLLAYLALYFVDVVGASEARAGLAVAVSTGASLVGSAALVPLLARVSGMAYVRASALLAVVAFPAFLLVPDPVAKLVLVGVLGALTSGWYAVLQGRLYDEMPERSATVLALNNVSGLVATLLPLAIGVVAERFGLGVAIWLPILAPVALLVGLPRRAASNLPAPEGVG